MQLASSIATQALNEGLTTSLITGLQIEQTAPIIIGSCFLVLLIASRTIAYPSVGPKMPLGPLSPLFNNISIAGFIAAMSFGHIVGTIATFGIFNLFGRAT
jgi:photosystem I subunit X